MLFLIYAIYTYICVYIYICIMGCVCVYELQAQTLNPIYQSGTELRVWVLGFGFGVWTLGSLSGLSARRFWIWGLGFRFGIWRGLGSLGGCYFGDLVWDFGYKLWDLRFGFFLYMNLKMQYFKLLKQF